MKVSIEGHYEAQEATRGDGEVWVPDQLIVECDCGKELRTNSYSALCEHGADHTALIRDAERELAENRILLQYRDFGSVHLEYVAPEGQTSTKAVYRASNLVEALTGEPTQTPSVGATDYESGVTSPSPIEPTTAPDVPSSVCYIENAVVLGELDLRHRTIERPLEARCCWFTGRIDLRYCEFKQAVSFLECTFSREFDSGDDKESYTTYKKELNCNGSRFEKATKFNGIRVEGTAYFHGSSFEFVSADNSVAVDFTAASFGRNFECDDAVFEGPVSFNSVRCDGNGSAKGARFESRVNFTAASFGRNLQCNNAVFEGPVSFNSVRCDGNGSAKGARFESKANFTAASFGRNLECNDAVFRGQVSLNTVKCGGSGFFDRARFESREELNFRFADFGINLTCEEAQFGGPVDFHALKCGHHVQFARARFMSRKRIELTNADVGGNLRCDDATFLGNVRAKRLKCNILGCFIGAGFECEEVDFRSTYFGGDLDLRHASFAGTLRLGQAQLMQKLRLRGAGFKGKVELYNVTIKIIEMIEDMEWREALTDMMEKQRFEGSIYGSNRFMPKLALRENSLELAEAAIFPFKAANSLTLNDISFERFHAGPTKKLARNLALRFVEVQDVERFSRDPHLQLERYYKNIGDEAEARKLHYKGHCAFRANTKNHRGPGGWTRKQSAWDLFLNVSVGYGLQAWRLLFPLLFILAVGLMVFSQPEALVTKADGVVIKAASVWHGLAYSFDLLIPVLTFPPADQWAPNGYEREIFAVFEVVIGWLFVPLMIAAWSGIIRND